MNMNEYVRTNLIRYDNCMNGSNQTITKINYQMIGASLIERAFKSDYDKIEN